MLKISIITICRNSEETIEKTIQSVLSQDYPNLEYIIIDGASTDKTLDIINNYRQKIAKIVSEKDNGIYFALNKGISIAEGEIIGFLNSDDFYISNGIVSKIEKIFENSNLDTCFAQINYVDENNRIVRKWKNKSNLKNLFFNGEFPPHPTFFVRKNIYDKFGLFSTEFNLASDVELMLRFLIKHKVSTFYLPEVIINMRSGGASNVNLRSIFRSVMQCFKAFEINNIKISRIFIIKTLWFRFKQLF